MKHSVLVILATILMVSCSDMDDDHLNLVDETLYFNSFETMDDLSDIEGFQYYRTDNTPVDAGDSSIVVSGGCIGPHLYLDLGPFQDEKQLSVTLMGKNEEQCGGNVQIYNTTDITNSIRIPIFNQDWSFYESDEILVLPVGDILRIEVQSGGDAACDTHIDNLTVVDVQ